MVKIPTDPGVSITYQLQYRRCGKQHCRCTQLVDRADNRGHGPYWYAYWREGKKLRSAYIGKTQPLGAAAERAARNAAWRGIVPPAPRAASEQLIAVLHKQRRPPTNTAA
jgi:hypothetical protein